MEQRLPAVLVEAFCSEPLHGNGAAVVLLEQPASAAWMQRLAGSFKQSETAFLHCSDQGQWRLRWFTPSCEVPLCGHATLAATLALAHWGRLQPGTTLQLVSRSGALAVGLEARWPGSASLVLPGWGLEPLAVPNALETLLGTTIEAYWGSALGYRVALLPVDAPLAAMDNPAPRLQGQDRMGLVLMQALPTGGPELMDGSCDYQLRFFAPGLGIDEDPVTGSAHAVLTPFWTRRLGRERITAHQASARGGTLSCRMDGDRVWLEGPCVTVVEGRFFL